MNVYAETNFLCWRWHFGRNSAGIVYARQGTSVGALISGRMLIYRVLDPEEMSGHVEYL